METYRLKRVLGLSGLSFIAIGFTIGGGVFVFTGIVLKITGPALPVAYGLAMIPVLLSMMPLAMLGSAIPSTGGNYMYPSRMISPGLAFTGIWTYALASFFGQLPLYAIGCARYARVFMPHLPVDGFAIGLITFFFLVNLLGVRFAAIVQGLMVVILISALIFYSSMGLMEMDPANFSGLLRQGAGKLALGVALLTFTYFGSNGIIELGGEIKEPGKVIPRALFIAFGVVALVYLLVSLATVAPLPWDSIKTSDEPMITVSRHILGKKGFVFFIAGGAILALTTTLNALFIVGTKSLLVMVDDKILPSFLGKVNRRFSTPHVLLTLIWLLSMLGILSGFSLKTFASYAALGGMIIFLPVLMASLILPRRYPDRYRDSDFALKGFWLWLCPSVGFLMVVFFSAIILVDMRSPVKIGLFFLFIASGILFYIVRKHYLLRQGIDLGDIKKQREWEVK